MPLASHQTASSCGLPSPCRCPGIPVSTAPTRKPPARTAHTPCVEAGSGCRPLQLHSSSGLEPASLNAEPPPHPAQAPSPEIPPVQSPSTASRSSGCPSPLHPIPLGTGITAAPRPLGHPHTHSGSRRLLRCPSRCACLWLLPPSTDIHLAPTRAVALGRSFWGRKL